MRISPNQSRASVAVVLLVVFFFTWFFLFRRGYYSFWFIHVSGEGVATVAPFLVCGVLARYFHLSIPPNTQGAVYVLGKQTEDSWGESNIHFVLRPIVDVWVIKSTQHFTIDIATQTRTKDGYLMMIFAVATCAPTDAYKLAKISLDDLVKRLTALCTSAMLTSVHGIERQEFYSDDEHVYEILDDRLQNLKMDKYGVGLDVIVTKFLESDEGTLKQFEVLARSKDMRVIVEGLKHEFPGTNDAERYAIYASLVGFKSSVLSYVVRGTDGSNVILGGQQST